MVATAVAAATATAVGKALVAARPLSQTQANSAMRVLFIGRLGSYKRLDWLLHSLASVKSSWSLDVVGDGPRRTDFEALSDHLMASRSDGVVRFHGRLSEADKLSQLLAADLLVLPSESSNEAFGIVQLEAMAAGLPALAFQRWRSGMRVRTASTSRRRPRRLRTLVCLLIQRLLN